MEAKGLESTHCAVQNRLQKKAVGEAVLTRWERFCEMMI